MGYKPQWHPPTPTPLTLLTIFLFLLFLSTTASPLSPPPLPPPPTSPPPPPPPPPNNFPLKPSMTIVVGILTTIFSLTFLLLLYAKHCRNSNHHTRYPPAGDLTRSIDRDHSGIDRTIIESLPVFRFGSLTGQKDGLECAVCLSVFDPSEVLRLLPKCKHAFHVECVDTWLDAHSTCPLCRYRVDPEDIFLILGENQFSRENDIETGDEREREREREVAPRRVSGRHSSAGENGTGLQISSPPSPPLPAAISVAGSRRSLDSWNGRKKGANSNSNSNSKKMKMKIKKKDETTPVWGDRYRKDGMLLEVGEEERRRRRKRLEHRIVVGTQRWSDVQPSDLLYLRSEMMIVGDVRRLKRSRPSVLHEGNNGWWQSGRGVINSRSVSEMTGLSRFGSNGEAGVVSRLLARLSEPKSGRNSSSSNV